jgi:hypothetical protein
LNNWIAYKKAYVSIPYTLVGTGTTAAFLTANYITVNGSNLLTGNGAVEPQVSLKNGAYSAVNGINLQINDKTLQSSSDIHLANHIRALTQWSDDYARSVGILHGFAKDTSENNDVNNTGFGVRVSLTNYKYTITQAGAAGVCTLNYQFMLNIDLALLSEFFENLNFPLKNAEMNLVLSMNGLGVNTAFSPIAVDSALKTALAGGSVTMSLNIGQGMSSSCRLYAPHVKLMPEQEVALAQQLKSGALRQVVWDDYRVVKNTNTGTSSSLSATLTPSIRKPLKLWTMLFPRVDLSDPTKSYPYVTGKGIRYESDSAAGRTGLTNVNVIIDSDQLYQENKIKPTEFYEELRQEFMQGAEDKQSGSLISFQEFCNYYQYYVCDLTRHNRVATEKGVAIEFRASKVNPLVDTDCYHVISCESVTSVQFNNGSITLEHVGNH